MFGRQSFCGVLNFWLLVVLHFTLLEWEGGVRASGQVDTSALGMGVCEIQTLPVRLSIVLSSFTDISVLQEEQCHYNTHTDFLSFRHEL